MLGRVLFLLLLLIAVTMIVRFREEEAAFYVFMAVAFMITILFSLWLRREETLQATAPYQFILDVVLITGIIHFTGGVNSELVLLYPLAILVAGIVVSGQMAIQVSIMSIFCYATIVTLEYNGFLVYRGNIPSPYDDPATVTQILFIRILIFSFFTAGVSYLADKCFSQNRQLARLQMIADSVMDNLSIPLLSIREDGRIVKANQAAAEFTGESADDIMGKNLKDFFLNEKPDLTNPQDSRYLWRFRRHDGYALPVSFEVNNQTLPTPMFGGDPDSEEESEVYLIALRAVSDSPAEEEKDAVSESRRAAAGTVTEMAHVLNNPLTAIRGAGELLNDAVDSIFQQSDRITEEDWRLVREMVGVIFQQTNDLDEKVRHYLEWAETDSAEFDEFLKNAEKWSEKVLNSKREDIDEQNSGS